MYPCSFWDNLPRISSTQSRVLFSEMGDRLSWMQRDVLENQFIILKCNFFFVQLKMAYFQKVFWLRTHCHKKVLNLSPEQKIYWKWRGNSYFLLRWEIWHLVVGKGTKVKIPSDIKQPLTIGDIMMSNCLFWNCRKFQRQIWKL